MFAAVLLAACAVPAQAQRDVTRDLLAMIAQGHCDLAVKTLNARLAGAEPDVLVLAAAMFEEGICVRRSWQRAEELYLRADPERSREARLRLVAGYARPTAGPDVAAALWWASRGKPPILEYCRLSEPTDDPEVFVSRLRSAPASKLNTCVYVQAFMSGLVADMEYPRASLAAGEEGTVTVTFRPSTGQMEAEFDGQTRFRKRGAWLVTDAPVQPGRGIVNLVQELSVKAAHGLPVPPGIDPNLVVIQKLQFTIK